MRCRFPLAVLAVLAGLAFSPLPSLGGEGPENYKVLAREGKGGYNVSAVQEFLDKGDASISRGNLTAARKHYDKAREVAKQLLSFYRDLGGAFRGLDARIPREMDAKGRETLSLLAKVNLRLAAVFRKQNQPEIAVPLLVEVVRLTTPAKPEGKRAYQSLVELGFVETPFLGGR